MAATEKNYTIKPSPYPASTKTSATEIHGIETTATRVSFADKILITITQNGRLAHWVHVPLDISATDQAPSSSAYLDADADLPPSELLPIAHLTATTILGGTVPEVDTLGQLLATQVASAIVTRDSEEKRLLVLGMGLGRNMTGREEFSELVGLVLEVV